MKERDISLIATMTSIVITTMIVVNILAIPICFIIQVYESFKTPEQRANEREEKRRAREIAERIEMEKLEREREARKQVEAYLSVIDIPWPILIKEETKVSKKIEEIDEDFSAIRCIWKANVNTILIFYAILIVIIMIIAMITVIILTFVIILKSFMGTLI
jgi:hypothetical protein